jgi:type IX secretion system PorP/SprF family membrane protein
MKSKSLLLLSVLLFITLAAKAQDPQFSQFYMAPLFQNPALAGANHDLEACLNYRNQWASVAIPYRTYAASFAARIGKNPETKSGFWALGLNVFSDDDGSAAVATTEADLTVSYHVHTTQYSWLGAGLQAGYAQRSISYSGLQWGSQYDGMNYNAALPSYEPAGANSMGFIDGAAGVEWTYDNTSGGINVTDNHDLKGDVGFAMYHINQPKYSFYGNNERLAIRYAFNADALISLSNSNVALAPGMIAYYQGGADEIFLGTLVRYKLKQASKYTGVLKSSAFYIGGYYRAGDAFAAAMMYQVSSYAFGISYDINASSLTQASSGRGGVELSLSYAIPDPFAGTAKATNSMFN